MQYSEIVLASESPRRKQMLGWVIPAYTCMPADIDETPLPGELPVPYTERMALQKARKSAGEFHNTDAFVIGSDTTVYLDHQIFGKPVSEEHAIDMWQHLRGRDHLVCTAVVLIRIHNGKMQAKRSFCESIVHLRNMSDEEVRAFAASGEGMDKAGAYAIQSRDFHPVDSIRGCYASVMGFPLCHVRELFRTFGYKFEKNVEASCIAGTNNTCSFVPSVTIHDVDLFTEGSEG